jgi:putative endonuclease
MNILNILTGKRIIGNIGESYAAKFLKKQGYKILERNFVASGHEIDIIAKKGEYPCFVEVKTRTVGKENPLEPRPASAVTPEKQRDIISAAKMYFSYENKDKKKRFDVIEVYLEDNKKMRNIIHMENAFRADSNPAHRAKGANR